MEKEKIFNNQIEELNAPKLQIDGIEEFEDRLAMGTAKLTPKWCASFIMGVS
jgi:hypothetical protein